MNATQIVLAPRTIARAGVAARVKPISHVDG
jgi:hypothetical protein